MRIFDKINIFDIIKDHISTLYDNRDRCKRVSIVDLFLFFVVPIGAGLPLAWFDVTLDADARNVMGITLAVVVGLLFNVLLLTHSLLESFRGQNRERQEFLQEVYFNLTFATSIGLICLVFLVSTAFLEDLASRLLSGFVYYFATLFGLTLLMVLKRLHALFADQFSHD